MYDIDIETQSVSGCYRRNKSWLFLGTRKQPMREQNEWQNYCFDSVFFACRASACTGAPQCSWLTTTTEKYCSEWGVFQNKKRARFAQFRDFFQLFYTYLVVFLADFFFFISFQKTQQPSDEKKNYNSSREVRVCVNQLVRLRKLNEKKKEYTRKINMVKRDQKSWLRDTCGCSFCSLV